MTRSRTLLLSLGLALTCAACDPSPTAPSAGPPDSDSPPLVASDWYSTVSERIADSEYQLRVEDDGFRASNRAQGFHVRWSPDGGVRVADRGGERGPLSETLRGWEVELRTVAWGREGAMRSVDGRARVGECESGGRTDEKGECLRRLEVESEGLLEWWENRTDGLEQAWVIEEAPVGDGPLRIELATSVSPVVDGRRGRADLGGKASYGNAVAWDAEGQTTVLWLEPIAAGLALVIDDQDVAYPLTIDPLLSAVASRIDGDGGQDILGMSVANAGDVNGDGYDDVVVGAPGADLAGDWSGAAYLFLGSSSGLGFGAASTVADAVLTGDTLGDQLGVSVAGAGDLNGDGFGDLAISAFLDDTSADAAGTVYVFYGSPSGLASGDASVVADTAINGDGPDDQFGYAPAAAGDVDGDGFGDLVVGQQFDDLNGAASGSAFVYLGSPSGIPSGLATSVADAVLSGDSAGDFFAHTVAAAGDLNGDSLGDLVVGAHGDDNNGLGSGSAFVFLGSASGIPTGSATATASRRRGWRRPACPAYPRRSATRPRRRR